MIFKIIVRECCMFLKRVVTLRPSSVFLAQNDKEIIPNDNIILTKLITKTSKK